MASIKDQVEKIIAENKVAVFTKSWCGYCRATINTFESVGVHEEGKSISEDKKTNNELGNAGIKYQNIELDLIENGDAIQDYLESRDGQRTVPNVFINQKHIGGNSDLQALNKKGQLTTLLKG